YSVVAYDAALNESPASNDGPVSTADLTPPSKPAGLTATQGVSSSIHLSWTPATDNLAVTDYIVTRDDGMTFDAGAVASYDDVGVVVGTTYTYTVVAYDAAGNWSPPSDGVPFASADTTAPSVPGDLAASLVGTTQVHLTWTASTDTITVNPTYVVNRSSGGTTTTFSVGAVTTYDDPGLSAGTTYTYTVQAQDEALNRSDESTPALITTAGAYLFADGFESGNLSQWTAPIGLTVETTSRFTGTYGVEAKSVGSNAAWAYHSLSPTQTNLHYRLRFQVASALPPSATTYLGKVRTSTGTSIFGLFVSTSGTLGYRNDA